MPIVRIGGVRGSDGEDYDTFDVAHLADRSYFSQNGNWSGETPRHAKTSLTSSTSRSVDSVSIDSYMGIRSEDNNRKGNMVPQYLENLDLLQNDPRTPLSNKRRGVGYIPEEDETSLSTMDDSAITRTPSMRSSSHHRHRQKQRSTKNSDIYSKSMSALDRDNSVVINQLEAHVAKVNFELATTKALLDELRLENRHLTDDIKAILDENDRLHDENDRLHTTIQTMEKEKLSSRKSSVQESIGTVRTTAKPPEQRKFSRVDWSGSEFLNLVQDAEGLWGQRIWSESTDGRNTFDTCASRRKMVDAFATYKSELRQLRRSTASDASSLSPDIVPPRPMPKPARNGSKKGELDVPFNISETGKKSSSYNISGNGAAPPMLRHTKDELDVPFSNIDDESSSSNYSTHSVMLGEPGNDVDVHDRIRNDEKQDMSHVGRLSLLKLIVGNAEKLQQVATITKHIHKACPLLSAQHDTIQEDDLNDPFSTWSAPGDPKRTDEKWIQSGQRGFSDGVKINSRQYPEMDISDISLDYSNADKHYDGVRKYSSFFENCSDDGKKKGFNLFRSFRK